MLKKNPKCGRCSVCSVPTVPPGGITVAWYNGGFSWIAEVHSHRSNRRVVAQLEPNRVRKIVEIGERGRFPGERNVIDVRVHVAPIIEKRSTQTVPHDRQLHRKSQFLVEHEKRQASNGKSGAGIARTCLIQSEAAQGRAAAGEKPLRQRNHRRRKIRWRLVIHWAGLNVVLPSIVSP